MKILIGILFSIVFGSITIAQPNFDRTPVGERLPRTKIEEREHLLRRMRGYRDFQQKTSNLRDRAVTFDVWRSDASPEEKFVFEKLYVSPKEIKRYKSTLENSGIHLFKLLPHLKCPAKKSTGTKCAKKSDFVDMLGISYSSRMGRNDFPYRSDFSLIDGVFDGEVTQLQTIIANIGQIPLFELSIDSPQIRPLAALVPASELKNVQSQFEEFRLGFEKKFDIDGEEKTYRYSKQSEAKVGDTFAMRSIAYELEGMNMTSYEDLIVVFRVAEKEKDGTLLIVMRELQRKPAPMIFGN